MKRSMTNYERIFQELGELKGITSATLEQAKKTNGRVTALESRLDGVDTQIATQNGVRVATKYIISVILTIAAIIVTIIFHP